MLDRARRLNSSSAFAPIEYTLPIRQPRVDSESLDGRFASVLPDAHRAAPRGCARRAIRDYESGVWASTTSTIRRVGHPSSTSSGSWGRWSWSPVSVAGRAISTAFSTASSKDIAAARRAGGLTAGTGSSGLRAALDARSCRASRVGRAEDGAVARRSARNAVAGLLFARRAYKERPDLRQAISRSSGSAGFRVGSAATNKILIRVGDHLPIPTTTCC